MRIGPTVAADFGFDRIWNWLSYVVQDVLFDFSSEKAILIRVMVVGLIAVGVWLATSTLRLSKDEVERTPSNLAEEFADSELEGRRLERVLGLVLFMAVGIAIVLPGYFLREPYRARASLLAYQEQSIDRGRMLFANASDKEHFDSKSSLQCANCHAPDGSGGTVAYTLPAVRTDPDYCLAVDKVTLPPEKGKTERRGPLPVQTAIEIKQAEMGADPGEAGTAFNALKEKDQLDAVKKALTGDVLLTELPRDCQPSKAAWAAPPLNTVLLRFPRDAKGNTELTNIITYGRQGTPMAGYGVAGGGASNEQSVSDLVNYLETIQLTPSQAKAQNKRLATETLDEEGNPISTQPYATSTTQAENNVTARTDALAAAKKNLDGEGGLKAKLSKAEEAVTKAEAKQSEEEIANAKVALGKAQRALADGERDIVAKQRQLTDAQAWAEARADVSLGQVLFETHCARCHTKYWSTFSASDPFSTAYPAPGAAGGGAFGPNLRGKSTLSQFPDVQDHLKFVTNGSANQKQFGSRGIGTGRMPGFGLVLSEDEIKAIVEYERSLNTQGDAWRTSASSAATDTKTEVKK